MAFKKVCNYLNLFLLLSRMSKHTRNKVSHNIDEALDYLLQSDEEDLGQFEDDNEGDSNTDSEYNDDNKLVSIATNVSIPGVDHNAEQVEFVVQEERPKRKRNIGPIVSLDISLDETNYDAFDPQDSRRMFGKQYW